MDLLHKYIQFQKLYYKILQAHKTVVYWVFILVHSIELCLKEIGN